MVFVKGSRRYVFLLKSKVIKIPSFSSWKAFILGVFENMSERTWLVSDYTKHEWSDSLPLAKIHFADRFGLCVVMDRASVYDEDYLQEHYKHQYRLLKLWSETQLFGGDFRADNVGIINDRLVIIDYGYCDCSMWLGNPINVVCKNGVSRDSIRWRVISAFLKMRKWLAR